MCFEHGFPFAVNLSNHERPFDRFSWNDELSDTSVEDDIQDFNEGV